MTIIIQILIALGALLAPDLFTEEYQRTHIQEIDRATTIYINGTYHQENGGVVIDVEVSPTH